MANMDPTKRPRSPDEDLAALLEGRLAPEERQRVLRELAADPDRYELLVESAAVMEAMGTEATGRARRGSTARRWRWSAAGLAAAAITLFFAVRWIPMRGASAGDLLELAAAVNVEALPARTLLDPPWQGMRGAGEEGEPLRLRRAGARLADLSAAVAGADAAAAAAASLDAARELDGLLGAAPVLAGLRDASARATAGADWPATVRGAIEAAGTVFDAPELRLGAWVETARLALLSGDASLLSSGSFRREARRLLDADLAPGTSRRLGEVLEMLEARDRPDTSALIPRLEALLQAP